MNKTLQQLKAEALSELKVEDKELKKIEDEFKTQETKKSSKQKSTAKSKPTVKKQSKTNPTNTVKIQPKPKVKVKSIVKEKVEEDVLPNNLKVKMTDEEKLKDTEKKLKAYDAIIEAYPFNHCHNSVRNNLNLRVQKLRGTLGHVVKSKVKSKVTSKVEKKVLPNNIKTNLTLEEKVEDSQKKLAAYEKLVKAYPFNSYIIGIRDSLKIRTQKLEEKMNK